MRTVAGIWSRRATGALEPGRTTWARVLVARCVATLGIAAAVAALPVFSSDGQRLALIILGVEAVLNAAAWDSVRKDLLPGLFLPVGDMLLAILIVATVPEVLAVAAIVFVSVTSLHVFWYGARASAALAAVSAGALAVIGFTQDPPYWIPAVVCLSICSATTIVMLETICEGVSRAQNRFEALLNGLDAVVWEKDRVGEKTFASANVSQVLGTTQESFLRRGFFESRVHPDDRSELEHARRRNEAGRSSEAHLRVLDDGARYRHLYERVNVSRGPDGRIESSRGLLVDESARWSAQAELRRYSDFIAGIPVALTILRVPDSSDPWSIEIASMNPAAQRMLGVAPPGTPLTSLLALPDSWSQRLCAVAAGTGAFENAFLELPELDGVFAVRVVPLPEAHLGVSIEDVTQRERVAEAFRYRARHDDLTGLANRAHLYERLTQVFDEPKVPTAALFVVDLDDFKIINDSLGHAYGDQVLTHFAARLSKRLRTCDLVARLGGDEFAIILTDCFGEAHAEELAARIVTVCETPFDVDGYQLRVGASVGVSVAPKHGTDSATMLRRADAAMYAAKRRGGGHLIYSPTLDPLGPSPGSRTHPGPYPTASA